MDNLRCTVTNCAYNSNEICTAKHIHVYSTGDGFANSSDGTGCRTFKSRSSRNSDYEKQIY